jgi:hypothetical protein
VLMQIFMPNSFGMKKLLFIFFVHISVTAFSQNVGIGLTSPATPLHVRLSGSAGGVLPFLSTATFESNTNTLVSLLSPDANNSGIVFGLNSNNISGSIVYNNPATMKGFQFRTRSNLLQMVLDSSGNVGIGTGTTSPAAKLEVKNALRSTVRISSNSTTDTSELVLSNKHLSGIFTDFSIKNIREQGLFFSSSSDLPTNTATNTLVLTPGGNVGVGIVPTSKLDINGGIKLEANNLFEFGAGIPGKEINAGKIGYNAFGQSALTFVGAGTNTNNRAVYFFAEGGTTMNGSLDIGGTLKVNGNSGTVGQVLTSNGTADPIWADGAFGNNIRFAASFSGAINGTHSYHTIYNHSPANVIIGTNSITILQPGLYHIEGFVTHNTVYSTDPPGVSITVSLNMDGSFFNIITRQMPNRNYNILPFAYDYTTRFEQDFYFSGTGSITVNSAFFTSGAPVLLSGSQVGKVTGYMISN